MVTPDRSAIHSDVSRKFTTLTLAQGADSSMNLGLVKISGTYNCKWQRDVGYINDKSQCNWIWFMKPVFASTFLRWYTSLDHVPCMGSSAHLPQAGTHVDQPDGLTGLTPVKTFFIRSSLAFYQIAYTSVLWPSLCVWKQFQQTGSLGYSRHRKWHLLEQATFVAIEIPWNECSLGTRFPGYSSSGL